MSNYDPAAAPWYGMKPEAEKPVEKPVAKAPAKEKAAK